MKTWICHLDNYTHFTIKFFVDRGDPKRRRMDYMDDPRDRRGRDSGDVAAQLKGLTDVLR